MVNITSLKNSIPSAIKWTLAADFLAVAGMSISYIPSTIFGVPTVGFVTVVGGAIATWEAYAIRQETASIPVPAPVVSTPVVGTPVTSTPASSAPTPVAPMFSQGGTMVAYTLTEPLGTTDANGYTVGLQYNGAKSGSGDTVPNGAYYLGGGDFGINGNYID